MKDNFLVAQTDYNRLLAADSPWSWFLGNYQFNQTESYRQRVKGFGGADLHLEHRRPAVERPGRCGYELGRSGSNNGWTPRVNVSTRASWKQGITLKGSASFEPAFRDFSDYLTVLELNVNVALAMMDNLSMYFTLRDGTTATRPRATATTGSGSRSASPTDSEPPRP